jgi:hypothetical protein
MKLLPSNILIVEVMVSMHWQHWWLQHLGFLPSLEHEQDGLWRVT